MNKLANVLLLFIFSGCVYAKSGSASSDLTKFDKMILDYKVIFNEKGSIEVFEPNLLWYNTVKVKINGKGPYRFILSLENNYNFISEKVVRETGLKSERKYHELVTTPFGNTQIKGQLYTSETVVMGDVEFNNLKFIQDDRFNDELSSFSIADITGIIGMSTFSKFLTTLDLANNTLTLENGSLNDEQDAVDLILDKFIPGVIAVINTDKSYSAKVYLSTWYLYPFRFYFCKNQKPYLGDEKVERMPIEGREADFMTTLQGEIKFAYMTVKNPNVVWEEKYCSKHDNSSEEVGLIGTNTLNKYKVIIDSYNKKIKFINNK